MAGVLIDARVQFGLARMRASAQRAQPLGDIEVDLREAMRTGFGFDDDGRTIEDQPWPNDPRYRVPTCEPEDRAPGA